MLIGTKNIRQNKPSSMLLAPLSYRVCYATVFNLVFHMYLEKKVQEKLNLFHLIKRIAVPVQWDVFIELF